MKRIKMLWMLGVSVLSAGAQMPLDHCIRYAWKHHASAANAEIEQTEARVDYAAAWGRFMPRVAAQAEVGRHVGRSLDPMTNGYTHDSYAQGTVGLDVTLSLFEGFARIHRLGYARMMMKEKRWNRLAVQNELAYQVVEAYYKALLDEQLERLAEEQWQLGKQYLKEAEVWEQLGLKSVADRREVEARCQGDVFRYQSCRKNRQLSLCYLKELIGMDESDTLSLCMPSMATALPAWEWTVEKAACPAILPRYQALVMQEKAARRAYVAAEGSWMPSVHARFSWGSDYYHTLYSLHQLRNRWHTYVGIGISFPLFSGLERYAEVRKRKLAWQRVGNDLRQERLHLHTEVEQVELSLRAGVEEYRQLCLQVAAEEQVLQESRRRWEEGMASVFLWMEARNRLLTAKAEQLRVRLQYEQALRLAWYYQTGTFIKE